MKLINMKSKRIRLRVPVTVTDEFYRHQEAEGIDPEYFNIRFGYRSLADGNLALVAWLPDLEEAPQTHQRRWFAFLLQDPAWTRQTDERFENWVMRNIEASFDVDNGPRFYLEETMNIINALTQELVGSPLFKHVIDADLHYPVAETTHAYQDAHRLLYGYVIDSLDKRTISLLADRLERKVSVGDSRTLAALRELFPQLGPPSLFWKAVNNISEQRRPASHGVRTGAEYLPSIRSVHAGSSGALGRYEGVATGPGGRDGLRWEEIVGKK
jgi:hypothetical protein